MIYRNKIMGSPSRAWEHGDNIMEAENVFGDFLERNSINIGENNLYSKFAITQS